MRPLLAEPSDDLEDTPPRTGKADVDLARINWNPTVNAMADAQRVEPGSWPWLMGGIAAWSGSSGEQASYGWSHAHKLTPAYIRAVLANYGHRRSYYSGAPFRQWNYAVAGRPHGWKPESPGDQPDGTVVYMTSSGPVKVSGPDAEHLWLTPLFAVFDDPNPIMVDTGLGNRLPSNVVAGFLARMLTSSAVGMVRDYREDGVKPYPWTYGDRATSRLLHTFTEAHKRGLLPQSDMPTVLVWIEDVVLPFYERGPGIHAFGDAEGGLFPMGLFNGLNWVVPAMHDAARVLERDKATKKLAVRLDAIVARFARWAADLEAMKPLSAFEQSVAFLKPEFAQQDAPVESLEGLVVRFSYSWDFSHWSFRSADILSRVESLTADQRKLLMSARAAIVKRHGKDDTKAKWLVGADGDAVR